MRRSKNHPELRDWFLLLVVSCMSGIMGGVAGTVWHLWGLVLTTPLSIMIGWVWACSVTKRQRREYEEQRNAREDYYGYPD